ncbi:ice-binding family protein [Bacteroidota bacterium]
MKTQLLNVLTAVMLLLIPVINFAQAPPLGTAADFVLFTSVGAMQNVGTYQYLTLLTGDVGTNSGSNTNFGNVNGVMHAGDGESSQCAIDVLAAYNFLAAANPDSTIVNPVLGNDSTFKAGTYLLPGAASLDLSLTLDAQGDPNAVFIFKMPAGPPVYAFSTSANAQVKLINGAQACNVFWFVTGAVSMGTGTSMKGTIIAGGSISMAAGDTLEGRALTINGSVTVDNGDIGLLAYLPVDISAPLPTGPAAPVFVESKGYAVFSSLGDVSDDSTSHVTGSVGGNSALPTGFNPLFVSGNIEGMNPATAGAAADLLLVYNSLSTLTADIELLAPAQFGNNLVLTPNTYVMNSAVTFTDTLILDATGNADAVFIIKTYGAFASGVHSRVILKNGTQAKNVFWMVNGAVSIGDSSVFKGTIIANNGAIDFHKGASLDGRALTTDGSISTTGMTTVLPTGIASFNAGNATKAVIIFPNPFSTSIDIMINDASQINNCELKIYNVLGKELINTTLTKQVTTLEMSELPSGIFLYQVIDNGIMIQSGKLISQ